MTETTTPQIVLGTMLLGSRIDQSTAESVLDRFVDLGGTWLDTADNYTFWVDDSGLGGASEECLGRWMSSRPGMRERIRLSTKVGAAPLEPSRWPETMEGLSPDAIGSAVRSSLSRLRTDHVDLLWAHVEDRAVPLEEQVGAFGELADQGLTAQLGASNHPTRRVERARRLASDLGVTGFSALQLRHSYLQPIPFEALPDGGHVVATPEALDYAATESLDMWAYSTLLTGAYSRTDRPLQEPYRHDGTTRRLRALDVVAGRHGATREQVVLSWLLHSMPRVTPIVGASSPKQVEQFMEARDLHLDSRDVDVLDSPT